MKHIEPAPAFLSSFTRVVGLAGVFGSVHLLFAGWQLLYMVASLHLPVSVQAWVMLGLGAAWLVVALWSVLQPQGWLLGVHGSMASALLCMVGILVYGLVILYAW